MLVVIYVPLRLEILLDACRRPGNLTHGWIFSNTNACPILIHRLRARHQTDDEVYEEHEHPDRDQYEEHTPQDGSAAEDEFDGSHGVQEDIEALAAL